MLSKKYYDFFTGLQGQRHAFLQGGRRSRKTWSTFEWLEALAGVIGYAEGSLMEITVLTHQHSQLQSTIKDFEQCLGATVTGSLLKGYNARTKGAKWTFTHCDKPGKAQGTNADFLFVNESLEVPDNILATYSLGIRRQIYYNFNPTGVYRYLEDRKNDHNLLCTTFRDNPYLTPEQIEDFEILKRNATRKGASPLDIAQYKVYYLGEFSTAIGQIFRNVERCTREQYVEIPAKEAIAIDFGFATSGDPTTCMGVKLYNRKIYARQYIYERGLTSNEVLIDRLKANGFNNRTPIFGDYGGQGRGRMDDLIRRYGWTLRNCIKGDIISNLSQMTALDGLVITDNSLETLEEVFNYQVKDGNKTSGEDHAIDAMRYAFNWLHYCG